MTKVSIIIPVYNVEQYLDRCLSSVLNQTYKDLEMILVNDGSTDKSGIICEEFVQIDKRAKVYHQENRGLSEARNTGLKYMTGDFVMFLDSDDWLELDAVEFLLEQAEIYNADMVVGGVYRTSKIVDHQQNTPVSQVLTQEEYAKRYFKIETQTIEYYVWNKLYKREVVEGIEFPSGFFAEDVPTMFRYILNSEKIVVTDKIVYNYFINNSGLTAKFTSKHFDVLKGWDLVCQYATESNNAKYKEWAQINRYRADLALLTEIALSVDYKNIRMLNETQIKSMQSRLKQNKRVLLQQAIPLSRKILIILFTTSYNIFAKVINTMIRIKNYGA